MIKNITACMCDICGRVNFARAVAVDEQHCATYSNVPEGWKTSETNSNVHICPACAEKLLGKCGDKQ